jgi:hypothetical protein
MAKKQARRTDDNADEDEEIDSYTGEKNPPIETGDWRAEILYDPDSPFGDTDDPCEAGQGGYSYTPPTDEPVIPSDSLEGAEVGTGFAPSMEQSNPDVRDLPPNVDNNDLDLEEDVYTELRLNSETAHLTDIKVHVSNGVVYLSGTVLDFDDIGNVYSIVSELDGVRDVRSRLEVAD